MCSGLFQFFTYTKKRKKKTNICKLNTRLLSETIAYNNICDRWRICDTRKALWVTCCCGWGGDWNAWRHSEHASVFKSRVRLQNVFRPHTVFMSCYTGLISPQTGVVLLLLNTSTDLTQLFFCVVGCVMKKRKKPKTLSLNLEKKLYTHW